MLDSETARDLIKPHMPVLSSEDSEVGSVDHVEGRNLIKLTKGGDAPWGPRISFAVREEA